MEDEGPGDGGARQELAPVDGGGAAWRLLCAAFVFETLLWGNCKSMHAWFPQRMLICPK
jgi:hypothetical protein